MSSTLAETILLPLSHKEALKIFPVIDLTEVPVSLKEEFT